MKPEQDDQASRTPDRTSAPVWPDRLTLRDTKVYADEGQRIFTNATGHGYEKKEYVRADSVSRTPDWKAGSAYLQVRAAYHASKGPKASEAEDDQAWLYHMVCAQIFAVLSGAIKEGLR